MKNYTLNELSQLLAENNPDTDIEKQIKKILMLTTEALYLDDDRFKINRGSLVEILNSEGGDLQQDYSYYEIADKKEIAIAKIIIEILATSYLLDMDWVEYYGNYDLSVFAEINKNEYRLLSYTDIIKDCIRTIRNRHYKSNSIACINDTFFNIKEICGNYENMDVYIMLYIRANNLIGEEK